jgi:hypothetical protein
MYFTTKDTPFVTRTTAARRCATAKITKYYPVGLNLFVHLVSIVFKVLEM